MGSYNLIKVPTNNIANCKEVGAIIEDTIPNIVWFGCLVHTLKGNGCNH